MPIYNGIHATENDLVYFIDHHWALALMYGNDHLAGEEEATLLNWCIDVGAVVGRMWSIDTGDHYEGRCEVTGLYSDQLVAVIISQ